MKAQEQLVQELQTQKGVAMYLMCAIFNKNEALPNRIYRLGLEFVPQKPLTAKYPSYELRQKNTRKNYFNEIIFRVKEYHGDDRYKVELDVCSNYDGKTVL
jgi:hypothetical protein